MNKKSEKPAPTIHSPGVRADDRDLLDSLPGLLWHAAPDGRRDYFNAGWLAFTGRNLEQELEGGWLEGIHPEDAERAAQAQISAAQSRQPFEIEYRLMHHSGGYRWMKESGKAFRDPSGKYAGLLGIVTDVTELIRTGQTLRESQALFEGLFKSSPDGVLVVDDHGRIILANRQTRSMFGFSQEEIENQPVEILLPLGDREVHAGHVSNYMAAPRTRPMGAHLSLAGRRKDGSHFPVDITLGPLQIGERLLVLATIRDITERKQSENELRLYRDHLEELVQERTRELESRTADLQREITERRRVEEQVRQDEKALELYAERLKRSNRDLQDFASIISHDLQEPLRKVQAFGERLELRHASQLDEEALGYLRRMRNAAERMSNMLEDLLTYSRVNTKGLPYTGVDMGDVVQDVISDLEIRLEETGGQVVVEELPVIEADPLQMHQLFQNLIGNALKFHRPETPPVIRISASLVEGVNAEPPQTQIRVADNGIGFEERYLEKLFNPFQRLHTRGQYPGSGMGLAICRKIAERHGGTITAQSHPGEGTTFLIQLPLRQVE